MLLLRKPEEETSEDSEKFAYAKEYISDELELIHDQQDNLLQVSAELEKAFSQTNQMKKLLKIAKKIDKTILNTIDEKRKQESSMINTFEDIKNMLKNQRYEDIDKRMLQVRQKSQTKIKLSQEELNNIRAFMTELDELYKESSGLCRLYQLVYSNIKQIYDKCQQELGTETQEEAELSRAGAYKEEIH